MKHSSDNPQLLQAFPVMGNINTLEIMKEEKLEIEEFDVWVTYHTDDSQLLQEAKSKGYPLVGTYSFIKHPPHISKGEYHLHVYDGSKQIFAINQSGKGHDGYHGDRIPNKVYQAIKKNLMVGIYHLAKL